MDAYEGEKSASVSCMLLLNARVCMIFEDEDLKYTQVCMIRKEGRKFYSCAQPPRLMGM